MRFASRSILSGSRRALVWLFTLSVAALSAAGSVRAPRPLTAVSAQTSRQQGADRTPAAGRSAPRGARISRTTPHLAFVAGLSPEIIEPGARLSLQIEVTPKERIHVYAPGSTYRPVAVKLQADPLIVVHEPVYSEPTPYFFKPLNETVLVYSAPFRIVVDLTAGVTAAQQTRLRARSRITIRGALEYQACDDQVCFLPKSVPLEWTVPVKR